jgi:putative oxidoreductase
MQGAVFALGRALLAPLFIVSGIGKFMNVAGILGNPGMKNFMALIGGGEAPAWFGYFIAFIEVAGALMILLGIKARTGAIMLFVFTLATILFRHRFWIEPAEQTQALKNFAIMGAMLMIAASGPGAYSFDNRSTSS